MNTTEKEYLEALEVVKKYNSQLEWVEVKNLKYKHDVEDSQLLCSVAPVFNGDKFYLQLISPLGYVIPAGVSLNVKDGIDTPLTATVELQVRYSSEIHINKKS